MPRSAHRTTKVRRFSGLFVLIASTAEELGAGSQVPGHADYYQLVSILVLIFSAIIAPELLCPDRRDRVLHLYLVRPLTSDDYVIGRWLAFFTITLALVYSGQIVLFVGSIFAAPEPIDYLRDNWRDAPRFLAAGLAVAAFTTTIPLAVSAFTTRRAFAAGFVIHIFFVAHARAPAKVDRPKPPALARPAQKHDRRPLPFAGAASRSAVQIDHRDRLGRRVGGVLLFGLFRFGLAHFAVRSFLALGHHGSFMDDIARHPLTPFRRPQPHQFVTADRCAPATPNSNIVLQPLPKAVLLRPDLLHPYP